MGVYVEGLPTSPADRRGLFYQNPQDDFPDMVGYMKDFMRFGWGGTKLEQVASESDIPGTPAADYIGAPRFALNHLRLQASAFDPGDVRENEIRGSCPGPGTIAILR